MTEPRRRTPAGRRDAELLLDGHGRRAAYPAAPGTDAQSPEDRTAALLATLLADAGASPPHVDTTREREALQHFRAAMRHAAPPRRSVRQRVAALSATAKVLSVAVGATATGGVALASASVPLGHGLRPFTAQTSDAPVGHPGPQRAGTTDPTTASTATALGDPASTDPAAVGDSRDGQDHGHWRGVAPGPAPTGFPGLHNPVTGPTQPATTPPPTTTTDPTIDPSYGYSLPPDEDPTTGPTLPRPPGFEEPPPDGSDPTPSDDASDRPEPDPSASDTPLPD